MRRAWGIGLLLLSVVAGVAAAGAPVFGAYAADPDEQGEPVRLAVRAPSAEAAADFADALRALGDDSLRLVDDDPDLVLALGEQAFRDALAAEGPPVLGLAVPRRAADQLITDDCRCSAIWQGVPLDTQLALLRALLPEARRIGILRAPHSVWRTLPPAPPGLSLEAVTVPEPGRLGVLLRRHLPEWDALLLPEDHSLFDGGAAVEQAVVLGQQQRVPLRQVAAQQHAQPARLGDRDRLQAQARRRRRQGPPDTVRGAQNADAAGLRQQRTQQRQLGVQGHALPDGAAAAVIGDQLVGGPAWHRQAQHRRPLGGEGVAERLLAQGQHQVGIVVHQAQAIVTQGTQGVGEVGGGLRGRRAHRQPHGLALLVRVRRISAEHRGARGGDTGHHAQQQ